MVGKRKFDEDDTLLKALHVFWEKGVGATTMQDLSEATGVQRGSLYNAYRSKEEIFLLAYNHYREKMLAEAREALAKPTIAASLRSFYAWAIKSMTSGEPSRGCLTTKTAIELASENDFVRLAIRQFLDDLEGVIRERCERENGSDTLAVDAESAARILVTYSRGIVVMERIYQDPDRLRASANALVRVLTVK